MTLSRRSFLSGLIAAPVIIKAASLMMIRSIEPVWIIEWRNPRPVHLTYVSIFQGVPIWETESFEEHFYGTKDHLGAMTNLLLFGSTSCLIKPSEPKSIPTTNPDTENT